MFGEPLQPRPFNTQYRCYSVSMFPGADKQGVENGGKSKIYFVLLLMVNVWVIL